MDLEALRAAVLNSRKSTTTTTPPSADPSMSSTLSPVANGFSPSATMTTPPNTTTATTTTTAITAAAITETITRVVKTQTNGRAACHRPPTQGSDSSNTVESDKEEGEISDEEMDTNEPPSRSARAISTPLTTGPQPLASSGFVSASPRPTMQEYHHQQQPLVGGSRDGLKSTTTTDNGKVNAKSEQTSDFTSLLVDYELSKARTDFRSHPVVRTQDPVATSDIPGLGQLRNRERSLPPMEDSFRPRNRSDIHYGLGSGFPREYQQSNSYSRDSYPRNRDTLHRGLDRPIQSPQRQLSSPATFPDRYNAFGATEKPRIILQPSKPEGRSTFVCYSTSRIENNP
ncbi:hypothetical protein BGZ97_001686 [Linnemannia gamsii]|uniref:Uncharacterized protein n=1 Tax=Linnemannia gamsii TaxID=64522 RepID=A0A9P6QW80_9FUNG|nr:hypothetical protein BGZ97_001686 [Linnemannia gamsii]